MLEGASEMGDLFVHRFQFAFTVVYHYLFPQLTMDLALLIVLMKARGLRPDGERRNDAVRHELGPVQPLRGERDRTDARAGPCETLQFTAREEPTR